MWINSGVYENGKLTIICLCPNDISDLIMINQRMCTVFLGRDLKITCPRILEKYHLQQKLLLLKIWILINKVWTLNRNILSKLLFYLFRFRTDDNVRVLWTKSNLSTLLNQWFFLFFLININHFLFFFVLFHIYIYI